jgi:hypothetical protein
MKISIKSCYAFLFAFLLLSQLYIPSFKINILIQALILFYFIFIKKASISNKFINNIIPLLALLTFPLIVGLFYRYQIANIIKDITFFLKPVFGIAIGYFIFKKIDNLTVFIKTIIFTGLISAIIHLIGVVILSDFFTGDVTHARIYFKDNFLELFSIFFLLIYKKYFNKTLFKKNKANLILFILIISSILYLSRTMLIVSILLYISIKGYSILTYKSIKIALFLITSLFVFYIYLFSIKIDRNAPGLEGFLFKMKMAPSEIFVSKVDRENHKELWDHWRGYEANRAIELMNSNISSYIVGTGFGSQINLKFYSPLGDTKKGLKFISEIHNGYVFTFYKTGMIGLFLMLSFLFYLYKQIYINLSFSSVIVSGIALTYFFTSITITGIFNKRDIIIFLLGALLYFKTNDNKTLEINGKG